MVAAQRRYSVDEWLERADEEDRDELVDGVRVAQGEVTIDHQEMEKGLLRMLFRAEDAGHGVVHSGRLAVVLDPRGARRNGRRPDLYFLRREHENRITNPACEGAPDLAIEVLSDWDRAEGQLGALPGGGKFADFERFGVPHYWVVDGQTRTVAQYALRNGRYTPPILLHGDDALQSPLFPAEDLPVGRIFAKVKAPESPLSDRRRFAVPRRGAVAR